MTANVVIVAACGANFASMQAAFKRLGYESQVSNDSDIIRSASHVVLPGVGAAGQAMASLQACGLDEVLPTLTQPVLGICLGMQLLCAYSEEDKVSCLQIMPLMVKKLTGARLYPHMGWNQVKTVAEVNGTADDLLQDMSLDDDVYFVHGFAPECLWPYTQAVCQYGEPFSVYIKHRNFHGVQFHPEKSSVVGEQILRRFIELRSDNDYFTQY